MTRAYRVSSPLASLTAYLIVLVCFGAVAAPAHSQDATAEAIGLQIALDASARNDGFANLTASMTMVLRNKQGQESQRLVRFKVLEVAEDGDRSLFVFDQPRDVQGAALLIHGHVQGLDDQWLYLPALKRVKRISSSTRSGSFMGSEFSYEDLGNPEVEKSTYKCLRDEPCGELTCSVTEQVPVDKKSSYSRQVVWQDTDGLRTWKVDYYDRKNAHLKTLVMADYQQYLDRFWRAHEMTMENHLTGKSTVMNWTDFQFQTNLDERDFTQTGLRRVR